MTVAAQCTSRRWLAVGLLAVAAQCTSASFALAVSVGTAFHCCAMAPVRCDPAARIWHLLNAYVTTGCPLLAAPGPLCHSE